MNKSYLIKPDGTKTIENRFDIYKKIQSNSYVEVTKKAKETLLDKIQYCGIFESPEEYSFEYMTGVITMTIPKHLNDPDDLQYFEDNALEMPYLEAFGKNIGKSYWINVLIKIPRSIKDLVLECAGILSFSSPNRFTPPHINIRRYYEMMFAIVAYNLNHFYGIKVKPCRENEYKYNYIIHDPELYWTRNTTPYTFSDYKDAQFKLPISELKKI